MLHVTPGDCELFGCKHNELLQVYQFFQTGPSASQPQIIRAYSGLECDSG